MTLAVTDLTKVGPLVAAVDTFAKTVTTDLGQVARLTAVAKARSGAEDYGNGSGSSTDMVDLGDLARKAESLYPAQSKAILDNLAEAVVYQIHGVGRPRSSGTNRPNSRPRAAAAAAAAPPPPPPPAAAPSGPRSSRRMPARST